MSAPPLASSWCAQRFLINLKFNGIHMGKAKLYSTVVSAIAAVKSLGDWLNALGMGLKNRLPAMFTARSMTYLSACAILGYLSRILRNTLVFLATWRMGLTAQQNVNTPSHSNHSIELNMINAFGISLGCIPSFSSLSFISNSVCVCMFEDDVVQWERGREQWICGTRNHFNWESRFESWR